MSRRHTVAALTYAHDLHAHAVGLALAVRGDVDFHVLPVDLVCDAPRLSWALASEDRPGASFHDLEGREVPLDAVDLFWLRRLRPPLRIPDDVTRPEHAHLIRVSCRDTLVGMLLTRARGACVNTLDATRVAENKLLQLDAASRAGLRVPRTLASQRPDEVRAFCDALDDRVIVKPIRGVHEARLFVTTVDREHLRDEDITLCPTLYQELIPGTEHLRITCFGDHLVGVLIRSPHLDWRVDLNVPFEPATLDARLRAGILETLRILGLRMGVVDMKLTADGEPIWLEVNPQGQFLFCEALAGVPLTEACARFLSEEVRAAADS